MCRYADPPEGVDAGWRINRGAAGGIHDDGFPTEDMLGDCFWYVIPTVDPGGSNRIHLTVYDCPEGTSADAIIAAWPPAGGGGACAPAEGAGVTLRYAGANGVGTITRPLVTDANGVAFWGDGVPTAPWSLELPPELRDRPGVAMCRYEYVPAPEQPAPRIHPEIQNGTLEGSFAGVYDHPPEQQADLLDRCHWFAISEPGNDAAVEAPIPTAEAGGGSDEADASADQPITLQVTTFSCDPEFTAAYSTDSIETFRDKCPDPYGTTFWLPSWFDTANYAPPVTTDGTGTVTFVDLGPGFTRVYGSQATGFAEPVVYCSDANGWKRPPPACQLVGARNGVELELTSEMPAVACEWYYIPLTAKLPVRRLVLSVFVCSEPVAPMRWDAECTRSQQESPFRVTAAPGFELTGTTESGSAGVQVPTDTPLNAGIGAPDGYGTTQVVCQPLDYGMGGNAGPAVWPELSATGYVEIPPIGVNDWMRCGWYFSP